ncbi:MAG TPA: PAS domain-containing protein [Chitinophagaceae bacterium]|nr:PAS domain-containing protein [Chitinophagaceae bacterium]
MTERSIFISYRKSDGSDLANWVHKNLNGRSHKISHEVFMLTTQLDAGSASGSDWKKEFIVKELSLADFICIVCSPAAVNVKSDGMDYFDYEISWWIENRKNSPPILVATKGDSDKYIPAKVRNTWLNPQVSLIDSAVFTSAPHDNFDAEIFMESVLRGMNSTKNIDHQQNNLLSKPPINPNLLGLYYWEKDRFGRYMNANELYAKAAGFDSPKSMIGKTDFEMPWRALAKFFQEGDRKIMVGNELSRVHIFEKEIMVDRVADILVYENVLRDHSNRIIGVTGYFIDVTGDNLQNYPFKYQMDKNGLNLGADFEYQHLDLDEIHVFQSMVRNIQKEKIAEQMKVSINHVESIMYTLKNKLQCSRNEDVIVIAVRSGLPLKLFGTPKSNQ